MTDPMNPPIAPGAPVVPAKPRRGCFFYGCITAVILAVIIIVAGVAGYLALKKKVTSWVAQYTDTQPMTIPTVNMSKEDMDALKKRFEAFDQAVRNNKPTEPMVLTSDEINALILSSPDAQAFKGKIYVTLDGDKAKGDLSLPLDDLAKSPLFSMVKGRYLNGSCTFSVSLQNGVLYVSPDSVTVKGNPLPDQFIQGLRTQNFATSMTNDANAMAVINNLQDIQIKDSKLTIIPKTTK